MAYMAIMKSVAFLGKKLSPSNSYGIIIYLDIPDERHCIWCKFYFNPTQLLIINFSKFLGVAYVTWKRYFETLIFAILSAHPYCS